MLATKINIWACKSVLDQERSYISIDGYDDEITTKYIYDNNVANSKQLKPGDILLLINKNIVLGAATVTRITESQGTKSRIRCPFCKSTNITDRRTLSPRYKCNKGHEFTTPSKEIANITKYEAFYGETFTDLTFQDINISNLRPFYDNGYNRNMSIQHLSNELNVLQLSETLKKLSNSVTYPTYEEADESLEDYDPTGERTKNKVYRQINARRGQKQFRDKLRRRYNDTCVITGCTIIDIIEAAHIMGYRDELDNHPKNGLLLRADIHTLFDLDLIGINPENLTVKLSNTILSSEYAEFEGQKLKLSGQNPNKHALMERWQKFIKNNPT